MKATTIVQPDELALLDVDVPAFGPDEILIRSRAVGICHSDFDLLAGKYIIPIGFPIVPGHEWAGEVAEVGANVTGWSVGDRVVGECVIGADHFGFSISGAAAEFFVVRPEWLHRIPDELTFAQAALVEPFSCAYYAARRAGDVDGSDTAVVFGAGPIGLSAVAALRALGATVIIADPQPERRALARRLGADEEADPTDADFEDRIAALTDGAGPSVILEASGRPSAMASALRIAGFEARLVNIGINVGGTAPAELGLIQAKALQIRGSIGSPGVWPQTLKFLARNKIDLTPMITATFPLDDALSAYGAARDTATNVKVHISNGDGA
ncbi:zinc-dependent alcohol dehydrogenase [Nakamurella deserti]|uniref:zinc-dependent alcohol dehydrogenase n=1 Tax=Nakamurella deserti TaxID=2164074 RepID=UPI000DBE6E84|nr:zinc-binding dehydrogenase [Nakamurella deserti]